MRHLALFGNVALERDICPRCESSSLIIRGVFQCCEFRADKEPVKKIKRVCEPLYRRKIPSLQEQECILREQDYSCFWCDKRFSADVIYHCKHKTVKIAWDHVIPFCYDQNNNVRNFVASCQFCNGWKSAKLFNSIEEVRIYVFDKWEEERAFATKTLFELQEPVQPE